jgi:hypothetical protein
MMTTELNSTEQMKAKWDEAFERLRAAEIAFAEYVNATDPLYYLEFKFLAHHGLCALRSQDTEKRKALLEANPAYSVPKHINDHRERICDEFTDIAAELMATPAPDLAALRWKLDWTADAEYTDEFLAQMRADMDRLMGPAPTLSGDVNSPIAVAA